MNPEQSAKKVFYLQQHMLPHCGRDMVLTPTGFIPFFFFSISDSEKGEGFYD